MMPHARALLPAGLWPWPWVRQGVRVVTGRGRERFYHTSFMGVYFLFDGALSRKCFNP
jgi:hypothetical protein